LYQGFLVGHLPSNSFDNQLDSKDEKPKTIVKSISPSSQLLNPHTLKLALQQNKGLLSVKQSAYERKYMIGAPDKA